MALYLNYTCFHAFNKKHKIFYRSKILTSKKTFANVAFINLSKL